MPFKHKKLDFGQSNDILNNEQIKNEIEKLTLTLDLKRKPIGIKLLYSEEDYENLDIKQLEGKLSYCQMILRASLGKTFKTTVAQHSCDGATTALALEPSNTKIESGEEYFSYNLFHTKACAKRLRSSIKNLDYNTSTVYGVLIGSLENLPIIPDVVIMITNPYQSMRLTQGFIYHFGIKPQIDLGAMQAMCSELTVVPLLSGEMNISMFCPSTRILCGWEDEEMGVAIPFERLSLTIDGVLATINSTDNKLRKTAIKKRFEKNEIEIDLDMGKGY